MTSLQEELEELRRDYSVPNWDGYDALPLNETSVRLAEEFIKQAMELFPELPLPSLCPHPSGDLGMDWVLNGHQLVGSIGEDGVLSYVYIHPHNGRHRGSINIKSKHTFKIIGLFCELLTEKETSND